MIFWGGRFILGGKKDRHSPAKFALGKNPEDIKIEMLAQTRHNDKPAVELTAVLSVISSSKLSSTSLKHTNSQSQGHWNAEGKPNSEY